MSTLPATPAPAPAGAAPWRLEPLPNLARGEDVVAGQRVARFLGHADAQLPLDLLNLGLVLDDARAYVLAARDGRLRLDERQVSLEPLVEILGNVDRASGSINAPGDLRIGGAVHDAMSVAACGQIIVEGVIEAASVTCGGSLHARGGVSGKSRARLLVGADLHARFLNQAHTQVAGHVSIRTQFSGGSLACDGRLWAHQGALVSGQITALGGVVCGTLGSPGGVALLVEAGLDNRLLELTADVQRALEEQRRRAATLRQTLDPLLAGQKALSAHQKERVTELLYQVEEADGLVERFSNKLKDARNIWSTHSRPEVLVQERVLPGVTVRFLGVESRIGQEIAGPLAIAPRKREGIWEICLRDQATGKVRALPTDSFHHPSAEHFNLAQAGALRNAADPP